jgi:hypothetical protein
MARSEVLDGVVAAVSHSSGHTYAATRSGSLWILSEPDGNDLITMGQVSLHGEPQALRIDGDTAYVALAGHGLSIVDVGNPWAPSEISVTPVKGPALAVDVAGQYAFVAAGESGLQVFDIRLPARPRWISELVGEGSAQSIEIDTGLAYVALGRSGLQVVDVSTPSHPIAVGSLPQPQFMSMGPVGETRYVSVSDGMALLSGDYGRLPYASGMRIVDVSDPRNMSEVGYIGTPGLAVQSAIARTSAYVASGASGTQIVDVSIPARPVEDGFIDTVGSVRQIVVDNGQLFAVDRGFGLRLLGAPGSGHLGEEGRHYGVGGGEYYLPTGHGGLLADAVGTMQQLTRTIGGGFIGTAHFESEYTSQIDAAGDTVIAAAGQMGLRVYSVLPSGVMHEISRLDIEGGALAAALWEPYALVAAGAGGLHVIDLSNPRVPFQAAHLLPGGSGVLHDVLALAVADDRAYLADSQHGVWVVDITVPTQPTVAGLHETQGGPRGLAQSGTYLWIAEGSAGISAASLDERDRPSEFARLDLPGESVGVCPYGEGAHVATGDGGAFEVVLLPGGKPTLEPLYLPLLSNDG